MSSSTSSSAESRVSTPKPQTPRRVNAHFLRGSVRTLFKRSLASAACLCRSCFGGGRPGTFGILMYHRVADIPHGVSLPTWSVSPGLFREQLSGLISRGYRPWSLKQLLATVAAGEVPPARVFVVTFDDGFASVHRQAWPILRELNVPATIFLATAYLDSTEPFPFEDWQSAGSNEVPAELWQPMTTPQCLEMADDELIDFGLHTHTHQDFSKRSAAEFAADLQLNETFIREKLHRQPVGFSFPWGRTSASMWRVLLQRKVDCGLTTVSNSIDANDNPIEWGRFDVADWDTAATLAAKLDGWYSWLLRPKFGRADHTTSARASHSSESRKAVWSR